jgi:hypothetical protein
MKIPKYWARSAPLSSSAADRGAGASCWHWSNISLADAQSNADARALELARKLRTRAPLDRYAYGDRPLREEIVQTIPGAAGSDAAVVTRNLYGALVLNAARAMFIDVDFADHHASAPAGGLLRRLFAKKLPAEAEERCLRQVEAWAAGQTGLGLKVYRTCAGLRCLVTSQTFDPTSPQTIALLGGVGSDPLYVRLCQSQACFRARLTPKPWRCGSHVPPARYPWTSKDKELGFRQWQSQYEQLIGGFGVCRVLEQFGSPQLHPEIRPILDLHDRLTCQPPDRPLA